MNYSLFRFEAVVDVLELLIHTVKQHNGGKMKNALYLHGVTHVEPVQLGAGGLSSHFIVTLNDVRSFAALQSKLAAIQEKYPLESPPTVSMIEVSFDGYMERSGSPTDHDQLAALAARMAYRLAESVSNNRRIFRDKYADTMPRFLSALERKMADGWNVGIGNKYDAQYQHCYLKTTDRQQPIPANEHRARFEIRLAGVGLPHTAVNFYRGFNFESLAKYISFRKEDENATLFQRVIIAAYANQASHRKNIKRRAGGGALTSIMPADEELNRIVRKQLQTLTKRWQRPAAGAQKGRVK